MGTHLCHEAQTVIDGETVTAFLETRVVEMARWGQLDYKPWGEIFKIIERETGRLVGFTRDPEEATELLEASHKEIPSTVDDDLMEGSSEIALATFVYGDRGSAREDFHQHLIQTLNQPS